MPIGLESFRQRESACEDYRAPRDPTSISKDLLPVCFQFFEIRRATSIHLRHSVLCVKKHLHAADVAGLRDILGQGGEDPTEGTSLPR